MTMIEIMVVMLIIAVLAGIMLPWVQCSFQRHKMTATMEDLRQGQTAIELFEVEHSRFPNNLEEAFGSRDPPDTIVYCFDGDDANSGHGNEICSFFDAGNPSGQNQHGGIPGIGYILRTIEEMAPCADIDFAMITCCGQEPDVFSMTDDVDVPGHPGNPQGGGKKK